VWIRPEVCEPSLEPLLNFISIAAADVAAGVAVVATASTAAATTTTATTATIVGSAAHTAAPTIA
jgi:hypothetical protein